MLRNYIDLPTLATSRMDCGKRDGKCCRGMRRGFSLVELLTVMAIVSLLMAAAGGLIGSSGSKSAEPAARIAGSIEFARAQAVARNRSVAIRFERVDTRELVMRFLWTRAGQSGDQVAELRRPERFQNIMIAPDVPRTYLPSESMASHRLAETESLVVTPDGQVFVGTGNKGFPVAADELSPMIHLGIQPTRDGRVVATTKRDVAIVQVQSATGTARVTRP